MQQFILLCIKKITIKNRPTTDTTRGVKGERLSNAFTSWTSEHKKQGKKNHNETLHCPEKLPNCKF